MSLYDYSQRRFRLAGREILDGGDPWFVPVDRLREEARCQGRELVSFANYDYLGLAENEALKRAAAEALERFGTGVLGSRLVGGERSFHAEFEAALADFLGTQACITLVSGYLTNVSVISHLVSTRDLLIIDELSHNSVKSGAKGTKAPLATFRHNDLDHLEHILATQRSGARNCLIVVEGLYSMDGDVPDLPRLLALKERYNAWLLVDEAHSIGVLGGTGRGISEHFGEDPGRIDLIVGTLSKTFVTCGGFLCARGEVIRWLRYTLPGFVYSVGLSPVLAAAARAALEILKAQPQRPARLRLISELFLQKARAAGLRTGSAIGRGVVPVLFPDVTSTMRASQALLEGGIYAPPVVHVGVPKDAPRIRFFLSAQHEPKELEDAVGILKALRLAPQRSADGEATRSA